MKVWRAKNGIKEPTKGNIAVKMPIDGSATRK